MLPCSLPCKGIPWTMHGHHEVTHQRQATLFRRGKEARHLTGHGHLNMQKDGQPWDMAGRKPIDIQGPSTACKADGLTAVPGLQT